MNDVGDKTIKTSSYIHLSLSDAFLDCKSHRDRSCHLASSIQYLVLCWYHVQIREEEEAVLIFRASGFVALCSARF